MLWTGEKEAWDILLTLDSKDIEKRAGASFNPHNPIYTLQCFAEDIQVSLADKDILSASPAGKTLITGLGEYSRLSILRYLIHAKDLPLSNTLVKPSDLPGGDFFSKGSHILPVDKITHRFENNLEVFINAGKALGGSQLEYGDVSIRLFPFPRVPVIIILWAGDDEFPSKSSLLFDSTCVSHMATDILWSTAMMTIEMMLAF
jgi:hypothetical protein